MPQRVGYWMVFYTRSIQMIMQQVNTVIWLDYLFHINLYRLTKRTLGCVIRRKKLWENSNNRESLKLNREQIELNKYAVYPKGIEQWLFAETSE